MDRIQAETSNTLKFAMQQTQSLQRIQIELDAKKDAEINELRTKNEELKFKDQLQTQKLISNDHEI